jgi:cell division protein FtsB
MEIKFKRELVGYRPDEVQNKIYRKNKDFEAQYKKYRDEFNMLIAENNKLKNEIESLFDSSHEIDADIMNN